MLFMPWKTLLILCIPKYGIYLKLQVSIHKKYAWISAYYQYSITTIGVGIRNKIKVEIGKASLENLRPDQDEKHDR